MSNLFRKEALEHQSHKLNGEVIIAAHMSFNIIVIIILAIAITGFTYLFLSEYQRKEVVSGYLRPTTGLNKVYSITPGLIDEVYVEEGDAVSKGQPLARIRLDRQLSAGVSANDIIIQELIVQKNLLSTNILNQKQLFTVNTEQLALQIRNSEAQMQQASNQNAILKERLVLNEKKLQHIESLTNKGFASLREYADQQDNLLSLKHQLEDTQTNILSTQNQLSQLRYQYKQLPIQNEEQIAELESQLAGINQQITQADSQRSFDVFSSRNGVVTSLLVRNGMVANTNQPLMTILPVEASLEAVLFVPTRAYGFIKENQQTRIRYQAFPYQRFGIYTGEIVEVAKSVILPNETLLPISFQEPVYRVVVKLDEQGVIAYGVSVPLQAGMLLEADIVIDSRSLFEWLFESIYSIRGTV
ncbi:HlyD family efflux transporter periplasmic adaptor subunit [Alteromonas sp. 5E99-2]|uniref:HlyD family secretion protein n=1 Tax=Alteromonas sp. 5E99-2 TaxID=2817683 RepID=UPI001A97F6A0|nr:HlyD family efflux transporter periplasmic adaptor subunit [Alteromonas sp. 5E99-2]MBO1256994.1 HlyD family efflux transporter periplasmic adaptor subunit [Alteromonas sp. 5E99-2]